MDCLALVVAADALERDTVVIKIRWTQYGYLAPILGEQSPRVATRSAQVVAAEGQVRPGGRLRL